MKETRPHLEGIATLLGKYYFWHTPKETRPHLEGIATSQQYDLPLWL